MGDLTELAERWRADLAGWAIPAHITAAVRESPWVLPRQVFARRADRLAAEPSGPSYSRARAALTPAGELMDVGSGAGAACLPLLPMVSALTAVDSDAGMLELLAQRAAARGTPARTVLGTWPEVAGDVPAADVVTCHHVAYNVPDPVPFLAALTAHARRRVVLEIAARHPLTALNPLWLRFHGLARPAGPTADDLLAICDAMRLGARHEAWSRPGGADYASFDELVDVTRRRLCLPEERASEVAEALWEAGTDPDRPDDLGSSSREVVTIWWPGTGRN
jgi:2-polyprenyl-3-methyl-5-hydroxy-6-metoxy-1,4-benzoquinol methylase